MKFKPSTYPCAFNLMCDDIMFWSIFQNWLPTHLEFDIPLRFETTGVQICSTNAQWNLKESLKLTYPTPLFREGVIIFYKCSSSKYSARKTKIERLTSYSNYLLTFYDTINAQCQSLGNEINCKIHIFNIMMQHLGF